MGIVGCSRGLMPGLRQALALLKEEVIVRHRIQSRQAALIRAGIFMALLGRFFGMPVVTGAIRARTGDSPNHLRARRRPQLSAACAVFVTALAAGSAAWGATIGVSNLGEAITFSTTAASGRASAFAFTTDNSSYTLASVTLRLFANPDASTGIRLRSDASGLPGSLVEDLGVAFVSGTGITIASSGVVLNPNTTYWITAGEYGTTAFANPVWEGMSCPSGNCPEVSPGGWTIGDQGKSKVPEGPWEDIFFGPPAETGLFAVRVVTEAGIPAVPSNGLGALGVLLLGSSAWLLRRRLGERN